MNRLLKFFRDWFPVIAWMAFMFLLSNQPSLGSGLATLWDIILRKLAHIAEYFILNILFINALKDYKIAKKKIILWAFILSLFYAIFDEYHQTFVAGRQGAARDVIVDATGIFLSAWLCKIKMIKLK